MTILYYVVIALHIVACLFLIGVVLLQQGKGQDLASAFGGGGTQAAFGPRGSATVLSRATTILAGVFMLTSLGLLAFVVDTIAGLGFGKLMCVLSGNKINPLIGACGISAFPMAARVVQKVAQDEDFENFLLMHAMGANAAGQIASVVAGGVLLALMGAGGH